MSISSEIARALGALARNLHEPHVVAAAAITGVAGTIFAKSPQGKKIIANLEGHFVHKQKDEKGRVLTDRNGKHILTHLGSVYQDEDGNEYYYSKKDGKIHYFNDNNNTFQDATPPPSPR